MTTAEKKRDDGMGLSVERLEPLKWFVGLALMALAIYGNSYFSEESLLYRVLGILVVAGISLYVLSFTAKGRDFFSLLKESRSEMRKIVWPTKQETLQTTCGIIVIVLLVALILWMVDTLLGWLILKIIG